MLEGDAVFEKPPKMLGGPLRNKLANFCRGCGETV